MQYFNKSLKIKRPKLNNLSGFSIVEILVVIVIIGILATILISAYSGVMKDVAESALRSDLENAANTLSSDYLREYSYPATVSTANEGFGLKKSPNTIFQYTVANDEYCLTASSTNKSAEPYHISSLVNKAEVGACAEHFDPTGGSWKQIALGASHTCRIAYNNNPYCWGSNINGRLGNGLTENSPYPVNVLMSGALSGKTVKSIKAGNSSTCVIASDDKVYCWGDNLYGRLGNASYTESLVPVAVNTATVLNGKTMTILSSGIYHVCAVDSTGKAYCWGYNYYGALGNNSTANSNIPVEVDTGLLGGKTVTAISAGGFSTCAIASGDAYCWGQGVNGELGDGLGSARSLVPVAVSKAGVLSGKTLNSITVGVYHACATSTDDQLYCWGQGTSGQLGDGLATRSLIPVLVGTSGLLSGKSITSVSAGFYYTCATTSEGKAYCWGSNTNGSLGDNSITQRNEPVLVTDSGVLSGKSLTYVVAGGYHTCAVDSDQEAYCWGTNSSGQLGNNTISDSRVPVISYGS